MKLKQSFIIALILTLIALTIWELYWRTQTDYYIAYLEDDRNLWAEERSKVETATSKDIILLGASRTGYNFNTHIWEETQGIKPINLSANGKPFTPFFEDIVNNTDFNGTLVIGVVPIAIFEKFRIKAAKQWVEHYYNRTYAQRLGFKLSKPLQRHLVMLSASELKSYNNLDLKSLINTISINDGRIKTNGFKLVNIGYNDEDRNLIMFPRMTNNPIYQKEITDMWDKVIPILPDYSDKVEKEAASVITELSLLINTFKAKGGKIIFIRHKAEEGWLKHAKRMMPRKKVWDKFIQTVNCPAYHFEDYEFMSKYYLPDWSHLNAEDAKTYTKDMVNQLIKDGHLTKH
ncbi:hypothetical protein [Seonamhaeicola aphaedonensis]|uniref:Uncharacterized protein n=1 Tax=Seonamhaeicola aphaedonensis TaxID=1461338 RepID=A0A3D9H620_9FLAO|nr:hypothetical protein [Seonamhaeicola aphaedonensis]RED44958.1 hypothetical protein DFQ02_10975 [Seonamhaeicola aphaedonensis]